MQKLRSNASLHESVDLLVLILEFDIRAGWTTSKGRLCIQKLWTTCMPAAVTSESFNSEPFSSLSCICRSPVTHFSQSTLDPCPSALALCIHEFMCYPVFLFTHAHNEHAPLASSLGMDWKVSRLCLGVTCVLSNSSSLNYHFVCLPIMVPTSLLCASPGGSQHVPDWICGPECTWISNSPWGLSVIWCLLNYFSKLIEITT